MSRCDQGVCFVHREEYNYVAYLWCACMHFGPPAGVLPCYTHLHATHLISTILLSLPCVASITPFLLLIFLMAFLIQP